MNPMIRALDAIATLLFLTAVGCVVYNLMWQAATSGQMKILSIEDLWTSIDKDSYASVKAMASTKLSADRVNLYASFPAAIVLLILSAIFYLPTRALKTFGVGQKKKEWR